MDEVGVVLEGGSRGKDDVRVAGVRGGKPVHDEQEIQRRKCAPPQPRVRICRDNRCPEDQEGPKGIGVAFQDGPWKLHGLGFPAEMVVHGVIARADGRRTGGRLQAAARAHCKLRSRHRDEVPSRHVEVARERPEDHDRADGLHAAVRIFEPRVAQERSPAGPGDIASRRADNRGGHPGDCLCPLGRESSGVGAKLIESHGPFPGEPRVMETFFQEHVDHGKGKRAVSAGPDGNPLRPGLQRRLGSPVVDHDHPRAALPRPQERLHPFRRRGVCRVRPPDHDEIRMLDVGERVGPPDAEGRCRGEHRVADVAVGPRSRRVGRSEGKEEAPRAGLPHPRGGEHLPERALERASSRVQAGRLGTETRSGFLQPVCNGVQGFVPADPAKLVLPPFSVTGKRMEEPVRGVEDLRSAAGPPAAGAIGSAAIRGDAADAVSIQRDAHGAARRTDSALSGDHARFGVQ